MEIKLSRFEVKSGMTSKEPFDPKGSEQSDSTEEILTRTEKDYTAELEELVDWVDGQKVQVLR